MYKNSLLNPITKTYANSLIEPRLKSGLQQICTYLKNNQNIYKSTEILSAGIYADTDMYPHEWGMGIDLFSAWEYTYNGKTYAFPALREYVSVVIYDPKKWKHIHCQNQRKRRRMP